MPQQLKKPCNYNGKIHQRKTGEYYTRVMLGYKADGTPNRVYVTGKTKKEVTTKRAKLINEFDEGIYITPAKITLGELVDEWLYEYKNITLAPRTFDTYESQIRNNIKPLIGHLPVKALTPKILQNYIFKLRNEHKLSTETISKNLIVIRGSLNYAVLNQYTKTNAAIGVKNFKAESTDVHVFTDIEKDAILETASTKMKDMCTVAFDTGLRIGELLALQWDSIDLDNGRLFAKRCVVTAKDREINRQTNNIVSEMKTASSRRTIPLSETCIEIFSRLKRERKADTELVFPSEANTPIIPRNFARAFNNILVKAGITKITKDKYGKPKITGNGSPHGMRHYFATKCFKLGIPVLIVSKWLGHADTKTTVQIYISVCPELSDEWGEVLNVDIKSLLNKVTESNINPIATETDDKR
jgi:integrase